MNDIRRSSGKVGMPMSEPVLLIQINIMLDLAPDTGTRDRGRDTPTTREEREEEGVERDREQARKRWKGGVVFTVIGRGRQEDV